jgi:hypothetical protein
MLMNKFSGAEQDGSAVSKTWRFLKKHGALIRSDQNIARFTRGVM